MMKRIKIGDKPQTVVQKTQRAQYEYAKSNKDIAKDTKNPLRRLIRHTVLSKKYGNMQQYYMDACDYYLERPTVDLSAVEAEAEQKANAMIQKEVEKQEEKAAKKAEREAKRDAKKTANEAPVEEAAHDVIDEDYFEEKEVLKDVENVTENSEVLEPNTISKGEDGLYHFTPVVFQSEEAAEEQEEEKPAPATTSKKSSSSKKKTSKKK